MPDETLDELLRGRLRVLQPRRGYRLSVDPLLLVDFAARACGRAPQRVCDLGAGVGVLGLALLRAAPTATGVLVELQPRLCDLARRNVELNGLGDRLETHEGDLRRLPRRFHGRFDLCVSNPPFRPVGSGHPNPDPEKALANVELACSLADLAAAAGRLLKPRGRLALVHDATRLPEVLGTLAAAGLRPELLRLVHPHADEPATRLLAMCRRMTRPAPLRTEPPLVLHEADGRFTAEVAAMLGGPSAR